MALSGAAAARTGFVVVLEHAAQALPRRHARPVPAAHVGVELQHGRSLIEPAWAAPYLKAALGAFTAYLA